MTRTQAASERSDLRGIERGAADDEFIESAIKPTLRREGRAGVTAEHEWVGLIQCEREGRVSADERAVDVETHGGAVAHDGEVIPGANGDAGLCDVHIERRADRIEVLQAHGRGTGGAVQIDFIIAAETIAIADVPEDVVIRGVATFEPTSDRPVVGVPVQFACGEHALNASAGRGVLDDINRTRALLRERRRFVRGQSVAARACEVDGAIATIAGSIRGDVRRGAIGQVKVPREHSVGIAACIGRGEGEARHAGVAGRWCEACRMTISEQDHRAIHRSADAEEHLIGSGRVVGDVAAQINVHGVLAIARRDTIDRHGRVIGGSEVPCVERGDCGQRCRDRIGCLQRHEPHGERGVGHVREIDRELLVARVRVLLRRGDRIRRGGQRHCVHDLEGAATAEDLHPHALRALRHQRAGAIGINGDRCGRIRVVREPPHRLARARLNLILHEHFIPGTHQLRAAPHFAHAAVNRREIVNRERTGAAGLALISDQRCDRTEHHVGVCAGIDEKRVLPF